MKVKKFFAWVICIVVLISSVFLPYVNVFATTVEDAQKNGNFDSLVEIQYWIQAADACFPSVFDNGKVDMTFASVSDHRNDMRSIYELRISDVVGYYSNITASYPGASGQTLYNAALEVRGQGKYKNGSVYCKQLGFDPGAKLMEYYGLNNDEGYKDLICGKNGQGGMFTVYMGYSDAISMPDSYNYYEEDWPNHLTKTTNGIPNDCRNAVDELLYFTKNPDEIANYAWHGAELFHFALKYNKDFKFSNFFNSYAGNLSYFNSISDELLDAEKYNVFTEVCSYDIIGKEKYEEAVGKSNDFYKIYHNNQMTYLKFDSTSAGRETYANGSLTDKTSATCRDLVEYLSLEADEQYSKDEANRKAQDIVDCYNTAVENKNSLDDVISYLNNVYTIGTLLVNNANDFKNNNYGPVYVTGYINGIPEQRLNSFVSDYVNLMRNYVYGGDSHPKSLKSLLDPDNNTISNFPSLDDFMAVTGEFLELGRQYRDKVLNGETLSDEDKKEFDGALETYKGNVELFKTNYSEKAANFDSVTLVQSGISSLNQDVQKYKNCLSNNNCSSIEIENMNRGFFEFTTEDGYDKLICTADDSVKKAFDEIGDLLGVTISYPGFTPSDPTDYDTYDPSQDGNTDPCYQSGIEGMSWILCPTLNNGVKVADGMSKRIDDWLSIEYTFYDEESPARTAWQYFRDIANVVAIIILLVIIVSQVTGYGIDNYGIKKMLPRLLVMMLLINLSFLLCQLAIDLSNILGGGLSDMFKNIGKTIAGGSGGGAERGAASILTAIFASLGLVGAGAGAAVSIYSVAAAGTEALPMIIILVALMVIIAVLAIVMFFLAIAARFLVVIVFAAISPLAFACFILPNTQGLFKKWWNIFKTALIVYPICGALYGMSYIVRAMIFQEDNGIHLWLAIVGVAAPYLPFLILPSLTKGALAGLGALGSTLTGLGNGIKSGIGKGQNALQHTEAYKNANEIASHNRDINRGGLMRNSSTGLLVANPKKKLGAKDARKWAARSRALAYEENLTNVRTSADDSTLATRQNAAQERANKQAVANEALAIRQATSGGARDKDVAKIFNAAMEAGNVTRARGAVQTAGRLKPFAGAFLKGTIMSKGAQYDKDALKGVCEEIAEGENAATYMSASPLGFGFATDFNAGKTGATNYEGWVAENGGANIKRALDNYVADPKQFTAVKGSGLNDFADLITEGKMDDYSAGRLSQMARDAIEDGNRLGERIDYTKAFATYRLAYGDNDFISKLKADGYQIDPDELRKLKSGPAGGGSGAAREGEVFTIGRTDGSHDYKNIEGQWVDAKTGETMTNAEFERVERAINEQRKRMGGEQG